MKIKQSAEQPGEEILEKFLIALKDSGITATPEQCKILVAKKDGTDVEITADKLKIVFNKE